MEETSLFVGNKAQRRIWKRVFQENKAKFSEKRTFTYECVSGDKKRSLSGKFGLLCFLETPVLRFAYFPYYRLIVTQEETEISEDNFAKLVRVVWTPSPVWYTLVFSKYKQKWKCFSSANYEVEIFWYIT